MVYQAVYLNDRLKRFRILNMSDPGSGKELIADNIRKESTAVLLSAAPELLEALENLVERGLIKHTDCDHYPEVLAAIAKARGKPLPTPYES